MKYFEDKSSGNTLPNPLRTGFALYLCLGLAALASAAPNALAQPVPGKEIHVANAHDYPFCEIGLITGKPPSDLIANIYNTTGVSDCPPEKFDAMLADSGQKLAKETGLLKVWLNPRRHWMFDEFWVYEVGDARDFDGVKASWMAKLNPEVLMKSAVEEHYVPGKIFRNDKFLYKKGTTVYLLDAPESKTVFVMQSWTDHWNKGETLDNLSRQSRNQ